MIRFSNMLISRCCRLAPAPASVWISLALAGLAVFAGCDRRPATYPVSGRVCFPSGKPVRMGTIETKSRELGIHARGTISKDGSFQLSTFRANDGAVAGLHDCVIVQLVVAENLNRPVSAYGVVDPKHNTYSTSGLTIHVIPGEKNVFTLQVSPLGGREPADTEHRHN